MIALPPPPHLPPLAPSLSYVKWHKSCFAQPLCPPSPDLWPSLLPWPPSNRNSRQVRAPFMECPWRGEIDPKWRASLRHRVAQQQQLASGTTCSCGKNLVAAKEGVAASFILTKKETQPVAMEDESGSAMVETHFFFLYYRVLIVTVTQTFNKSLTNLTNFRFNDKR